MSLFILASASPLIPVLWSRGVRIDRNMLTKEKRGLDVAYVEIYSKAC